MKYGIIFLDGRQFSVTEGMNLNIAQIRQPLGTELLLNKLLLLKTLTYLYIGKPFIIFSFISVIGEIIEQTSRTKLIVFKMRKKKKYRHHLGYRMAITKILLKRINCK